MKGIKWIFLIIALITLSFGTSYLERGNVIKAFERFIEGKPDRSDLYLIKSIGEIINVEPPAYMKFYTRGLLLEKKGNIEGAIDNYLKSIKLNPGYNPSYFRFNHLIRKVKNPEEFRNRIESIIKERFSAPPPVLITNPEGKHIFIVEKMSQYLLIYNGMKLEEIHPVTTGMDWEDKWREGDKRTPEGIYHFTRFIPPRQLPKMYGGIAVVMNYPNPVDRILRKGGSGIWLHGSETGDRNKIPFSTRGCVVAENTSLKEIVKKIRIHNTLIAVYKTVPTGKMPSDVMNFLKEWEKSWEERNADRFLSLYSEKFRWKRGGYKEWIRYKKRVIGNKKRISVEIKDLTVLGFWKESAEGPEYYVAEFFQRYESDSYSDKGLKRLYIMKEGGKLKIISEEFFREGRK